MSHSRIFQYSDQPITEENYLTDEMMCNDNYLWNKFEGEFCGDYTDECKGTRRIESIEWLNNSMSKLKISWDGKDKFTLEKEAHDAIQDFWYSRISKSYEELDKYSLGSYATQKYNLKYSVIDPLSLGFGFLFFNENNGLTASDDFFEWLLDLKEEDSFYIGGVLDYHC